MNIPTPIHRRARKARFGVGASIALGLAASVGLQLGGEAMWPAQPDASPVVTAGCTAPGTGTVAL